MLTSRSPAVRAWPVHLRGTPPSAQRRVALLSVALFLPKEQGKETEAVNINMCIIKRKQRQTNAHLTVAGGACVDRPSPWQPAAGAAVASPSSR